MNSKLLGIVLVIVVSAVAAGGYWLGTTRTAPDATGDASASGPKKPLYYRNPMNPEVTSPVPAKDSMGMDYVPVYADDSSGSDAAGVVKIDPVTVQSIGVRIAKAERRSMGHAIRTVGRVDYDERLLVQLHPKVEGWIEQLFVNTTGEPVNKNDRLLSIYSPELVSTQQEYVVARRNLERLQKSPFPDVRRGAEELVKTSIDRLRFFDMPEHQLDELEQTLEIKRELHIHSPADGIVLKIGARQGQYVTPRTELYAIADLSTVWVYVDIYEDELSWIAVGDPANLTVTALPGRTFQGKLTYIYPYAEDRTRTIKVRMEFDNPGLVLKPAMFANVAIEGNVLPDVIAVPSEAIIRSGTREQIFVQREAGKFEPRAVELGVSSEGWTQIITGVAPGEDVVVSAQFLIDSESKLREAAAKMRETSE
jgi:Cu(I)/Ag(I) efflux system membrane fusion protein